jgi:hypothetical protein
LISFSRRFTNNWQQPEHIKQHWPRRSVASKLRQVNQYSQKDDLKYTDVRHTISNQRHLTVTLARLSTAARINSHHSFGRVRYWVDKQQMLVVSLEGLSPLVAAYEASHRDAQSYESDPRIKIPDPRPGLRLALAVESVCSCVYAMTEIAANFGHHVTAHDNPEGQLPRSFNSLKKRLRIGLFPSAAAHLGDLVWHDNLHAMRTEWAHFSSIFLGWDDGKLVAVGSDLRGPEDKRVLKASFMIPLQTVQERAIESLLSLDRFATYLLPAMVAKMDLAAVRHVPVLDENGMMVFTHDHRVELRQCSIQEQLIEMGLGDLIRLPAEESFASCGKD